MPSPDDPVSASPNAKSIIVPGHEILGVLGRGGMGVVYKARHSKLKRLVALKMILAGGHASEQDLARFRIEAEAVARLQHPNIVQIYEVGEQSGLPYFSLEFCDGGSLAGKLRGTPLSPRAAAALVDKLGRAMHSAHQQSIVHRDLKPANILLTQDGTPKITDFGLAKQLDLEQGQTQSGTMMGTPSYMAPEQAEGRVGDIGPAADTYALGAILYEMLTGRPPFRADTPLNTILQVVSDEPVPPSQLQPKVPRDLETICLKCLQKDARKRYASAQALADDLEHFMAGEPIKARRVGVLERAIKWARRRPAIAALSAVSFIVAVVGFVLVTWQWQEAVTARGIATENAELEAKAKNAAVEEKAKADAARREAQRQSATLALDRGLRFCEEGDVGTGMLWLAQSLRIAPADAADLQRAVRSNLTAWRQRLCRLKARLPHRSAVLAVAFSPDGKIVLTGGADGISRLWDAVTGQPLGPPQQHQGAVTAVTFSPDGKTFLTGTTFYGKERRPGEARLWDVSTGQSRGKPLLHQGDVLALAFSPDGKTIVTGSNYGGPGKGEARLWASASGEPLGAAIPHQDSVYSVAFSPNGKTFVTACRDKTVRFWEVATSKPFGAPLAHREMVRAVAFNPDGKMVLTGIGDAVFGTSGEAQLWDVSGRPIGPSLPHEYTVAGVAFSPDGKILVTGSIDRTARFWDAADGKMIAAAIRHQAPVMAVAVSPDGKTLVTGSGQIEGEVGEARLWEIAVEKPLGPPYRSSLGIQSLAVSPDGNSALIGTHEGKAQVWDPLTGKPITPILPHGRGVCSAAFSPDGKLVLTGPYDGMGRLWNAATGAPIGSPLQHQAEIRGVAFSPDGKIAMTAGREDMSIRLWQADSGQPIGSPIPHIGGYAPAAVFSPDSKQLLVALPSNAAQRFDVASTKPAGAPFRHRNFVASVAYSPDGKTVLTGSWDNTAQLWEAATGKPLGISLQHQDRVTQAIFSPNGRLILTGGWDNMAQLWETATGKPVGPPMPHQTRVGYVAFSADGQTILTHEAWEGISRLWDVSTSKPLGPPFSHIHTFKSVTFSPDSRKLLIGRLLRPRGIDSALWPERASAHLWAVPAPMQGEAERIELWSQVITNTELDSSGAVRALDLATWHKRRQQLEVLGGPPSREK